MKNGKRIVLSAMALLLAANTLTLPTAGMQNVMIASALDENEVDTEFDGESEIVDVLIPEDLYQTVTEDDTLYYVYEDHAVCIRSESQSEKIVIPAAINDVPVTEIETGAFFELPMKEVVVPASVNKMADIVFGKCAALERVVFEGEPETLPANTFTYCTALKEVQLPKNLKAIGDLAFNHCESLLNLELPNEEIEIAETAFMNTPFGQTWFGFVTPPSSAHTETEQPETVIDEENSVEYAVYSDHAEVKQYKGRNQMGLPDETEGEKKEADISPITDVTILAEVNGVPVTKIQTEAFNSIGITSVVIPASVCEIGKLAFAYCNALKSVTFEGSIAEIPAFCFCHDPLLTSITIPEGTSGIQEGAFSKCENLSEVILPHSLASIHPRAFTECPSLKELAIPEPLLIEISEEAFDGMDEDGMQHQVYMSLLDEALENQGVLTTGYDESGNCFYEFEGFAALRYLETSKSPVAEIPAEWNGKPVTEIISTACYGLENRFVSIPDSVEIIGAHAFQESQLQSFELSHHVKVLGDSAFRGMVNLKSVVIPNSIKTIPANCFADSASLTKVVIEDGVEAICAGAFKNCPNLESVTIPESVKYIAPDAFAGTLYGDADVVLHLQNETYKVDVYADHAEILEYQSAENLVYVPSTILGVPVTKMAENLYESAGVEKVIVADGVTELGMCFAGSNIRSIVIPASVTSIAPYAFSNCEELTSVVIEAPLTSLPKNVFAYCDALTEVTLPDTLENIGDYSFAFCQSLQTLEFPASLKSICNYAFQNAGLTEVKLEEGLESIGDYAFNLCTALQQISVPQSVKEIGTFAFANLPENEEKPQEDVFTGDFIAAEQSFAANYAKERGFRLMSALPAMPLGDIDLDGEVNICDVILFSRILNEDPTIENIAQYMTYADMNGDECYDANDLTMILKKIAKLDD